MSKSPFLPGLVSITFRKLTPQDVVKLAAEAKLAGIEWGGDVHVPAGDLANAREVAKMTTDAGLQSAAYGSYYRAGTEPPDSFERIIDTALALDTRIIRIWVGKGVASATIDEAQRAHIISDCRHIAQLAQSAGLMIACEWHDGTLTDSAVSGAAVLAAVDSPAFKTYWQPRTRRPHEASLPDMDAALRALAGVHVFQWDESTGERRPLAEGKAIWQRYLKKLAPIARHAGGLFALLEFVRNDDPQQLIDDAKTLQSWLDELDD